VATTAEPASACSERVCTAADYRSAVDRDAMARNQRRRQVEEALDDERGRAAALAEQLEGVVAETDGPRIDERVFERLDPDDVTLVREALQTSSPFDEDEDESDAYVLAIESEGPEDDGADSEIARLLEEIADSRRRQLAYERYLDALDA
jgi:uncharacterized Zn finger protein